LEGTPFEAASTILVKGNNKFEMDRMVLSLKSVLKSILVCYKSGHHIKGGPVLFYKLFENLENIRKQSSDDFIKHYGLSVLAKSLLSITRTLYRNSGKNAEEEIFKLEAGKEDPTNEIFENIDLIKQVVSNASLVSVSLLMVDEIIKAGKAVKDEKKQQQ